MGIRKLGSSSGSENSQNLSNLRNIDTKKENHNSSDGNKLRLASNGWINGGFNSNFGRHREFEKKRRITYNNDFDTTISNVDICQHMQPIDNNLKYDNNSSLDKSDKANISKIMNKDISGVEKERKVENLNINVNGKEKEQKEQDLLVKGKEKEKEKEKNQIKIEIEKKEEKTNNDSIIINKNEIDEKKSSKSIKLNQIEKENVNNFIKQETVFTKKSNAPPHQVTVSDVGIGYVPDGVNLAIAKEIDNTKEVLSHACKKTGIVYDVRMRGHAKVVTSSYDYADPHPEDPRRIYRIYKTLAEAGLITDNNFAGIASVGKLMRRIPVREASEEEVTLVHSKDHWNFMKSIPSMTREELIKNTDVGDSVYFNTESFYCAKLSVGGAIEACKAVIEEKVKNAIAIIRPPGHHAEPEKPGGFCMFNNVSVAASIALKEYPEKVKRILILDWDIHHGNGTQKTFYNDNRVLYISLHRYDDGKFYPSGSFGNMDKCGEGVGEGFNVNIPWPCGGMQDGDYIHAFQAVIMPIAMEFDPDLVIISSGFDAAAGDEIGCCFVTPPCYGQMTHMLKSLANGKVVVCLEGGYNLDSISVSALAVARVLLGEPPGIIKNIYYKPEAARTIQKVTTVQAKYWKCMRQRGTASMDLDTKSLSGYENLHNVLRTYQARYLFDKYSMTILPIFRDNLSRSFENQVLATQRFQAANTLLVIAHDGLDVFGYVDPITGLVDTSQSYLLAPENRYIDWAAKERGFGVIDVNIPKIFLDMDSDVYASQIAAQDVMVYLWDNYIDLTAAQQVIFFAIGDACSALVHLLGHRDIRDRVPCAISIIASSPLKGIASIVDEHMIDWYHKHSLVITSSTHPVWEGSAGNNSKRRRKKFGNLFKADKDPANVIMNELYEDIIEFMDDKLAEEKSK